jgi:methylenetetrahydrofolate--tRNA-(uracil-5-)-methyltransferase
MIPGLENAEFFRYGVMHRNTYINSPGFLTSTYSVKANSKLYFAGQMTGVEGYVESTSSGYVAGINAAMQMLGKEPIVFPKETEIGALAHYVSEGGVSSTFQPMNANFGIIKQSDKKIKDKKERYNFYASRSLDKIKEWTNEFKNIR